MAQNASNLATTLDAISEWISQYTVLPGEYDAQILALWSAHTWTCTASYSTPRLVISSPVPGSGKTRVLELLALISHDPRLTVSTTPAALFRRIGAAHMNGDVPPTILIDETDSIFGSSNPSEGTEQLRGLINSGYKRGGSVDRCEGDAHAMKVVEWPTFSPIALAGLAGKMPDTITTRAITIEMRKRAPHEHVKPYRERTADAEITHAREALATWSPGAISALEAAEPDMPEGVVDRPAEVWEPLLAIADSAGGHWPETARAACVQHVNTPQRRPPSLGVQLLADIREIMGHGTDKAHQTRDRISTKEAIQLLAKREESPWADMGYGKSLTPLRLSQLLAGYSISPVQFRDEQGRNTRGYRVDATDTQVGLADAWLRYLPTLSEPATPATPATPQVIDPENVAAVQHVADSQTGQPRHDNPPIPAMQHAQPATRYTNATENSALTCDVADVADVAGFQGMGRHPLSEIETAILASLSAEHPLSESTILGSVPARLAPRETVKNTLRALVDNKQVTVTPDERYLKADAQ